MKRTSSRLLLAALIASASTLALAQPMQGGGGMDPAAMQQRRAEHQAELKAQLQLTPQQEAAWATFTAAMQPPQAMRLTPAERGQLTDAQRAERRQEFQQFMAQRKAAIETFRAQLTPEQQQVFDQHAARMQGHMRGGRRGGMSGN